MLDPSDRHVYLEALKPPEGYVFGEAVATTYALDLTTLLGASVALVLPQLDAAKPMAKHEADVLRALRQASSRLTIFCDPAGIAVPPPGVLYSLLEPVIVQARAPHGGSLHAKCWLIRFDPDSGTQATPWMRLIILSRNLTSDRAWDVSVVLDGDLGATRKLNEPLVQLLEQLPSYALHRVSESALARLARLTEQVARTDWELPDGFDALAFHVLGIGPDAKSWLPEPSERLVVISPFVSSPALLALQASTRQALALIARAEELERCDATSLRGFDRVHVLDDAAVLEDGEDTSDPTLANQLRGLHAKAYITKRGWNTHLYLGSANATSDALMAGRNIELMLELSGRTSAVPGNGIDGLLATSGLGALLVRYQPAVAPTARDAAVEQAEQALCDAAQAVARCGLELRFEPQGVEHVPVLWTQEPIALAGVAQAWAWLITSDASSARPIEGLLKGQPVQLANCATASATGLVGFELLAATATARKQFVLNLPVTALPVDRDAQIVCVVMKSEERLIQYILGLLQGFDPFVRTGLDLVGCSAGSAAASAAAGAGLLEHVVRTKARNPERLDEVRAVLRALAATREGRALVPAELASLWRTVTGEVVE